MSTIDYVLHGLGTAMQWHNVVFVFLGVLIGTVVGVLTRDRSDERCSSA